MTRQLISPRILLAATALTLSAVGAAPAQTLPADFYTENVGGVFTNPVSIDFSSNGWVWVAEQRGMVWIIDDGATKPEPFLDLRNEVNGRADRGLLGLAVHPQFEQNGWVYVLYTVDPDEMEPDDHQDSHTYARLERYTADPLLGRAVADPLSKWVIIGDPSSGGFPSCHSSHTIGTLRFGEDGTLFAGSGDGAHFDGRDCGGRDAPCFEGNPNGPGFSSAFDVGAFRSQHLDSLSGKIVRIDPNTGLGLPSNPYFTGDPADARSKVWVYGLRNP